MTSARDCFVIMPFSTTETCSEEEWTSIFETKIKPAVEASGHGYVCRRSQATRGNVLAGIMQQLATAHVVIADLTDANPNVFYELGVRHALTDRTILIAQDERAIPFDLRSYAWHVYNWRDEGGIRQLFQRIKDLLDEIERQPDRPDNPVSDFVREHPDHSRSTPAALTLGSLVPSGGNRLDGGSLARQLNDAQTTQELNSIRRQTSRELTAQSVQLIGELAELQVLGSISKEIEMVEIIEQMLPLADRTYSDFESFSYAAAELDSEKISRVAVELTGPIISASEVQNLGTNRVALGAPAYYAWRTLMISGAVALMNRNFASLRQIVQTPVEVEKPHGEITVSEFWKLRDLFWPSFTVGNADYGYRELHRSYEHSDIVRSYFQNEVDFLSALGVFELVIGLLDADQTSRRRLYPGYTLNPQNRRAISSFSSRLDSSLAYRESIASLFDESATDFVGAWQRRVQTMNQVEISPRYFAERLPEAIGDPPKDDW